MSPIIFFFFISGPITLQTVLLPPPRPKKAIGTFKFQIGPKLGEEIAFGQTDGQRLTNYYIDDY